MSVTFGQFISTIANEINRDDLNTEIGDAINAAITEVETERYTFNQAIDTTKSFTSGVSTIALPDGFFSMVSFKYSDGSYTRTLQSRSINWIEEQDDNSYTSRPEYYAIFNEDLRIFPVPNSAYACTISYFRTYTQPAVSGDTHNLIDNAYNLIKYKAKAFLFPNLLDDPDRGTFFQGLATAELARLKRHYNLQNQSNQLEAN